MEAKVIKPKMKTPISYYGGKQSLLKHILPLIPKHKIYVEPFFGGGAVFFAKEPAKVEVINDHNAMVVNFFEQLKTNFDELKEMIDATPYSRTVYKKAMTIYEVPIIFSPKYRAWAFWVATLQGFANQIGSWHSSNKHGKEAGNIANRRIAFTRDLSDRLSRTQIESKDAVSLIKSLDSPDTFFYVDPPYVGAHQGHYGGYTQEHFNQLLEALANIKGKFLLSSYPNNILDKYRERCNWNNADVKVRKSGKNKVEALTYNY